MVATVLFVALLPGFYLHAEWFFGKRETGPFSVKKRVEYTDWLMDRLFVKDRIVRNLDVDMGAHLWWSEHLMVDMAGLVDVSVAHHGISEKPFAAEYVFKEQKPDIAHVHGGWATNSKLTTFNEWKRDYVEIQGFPNLHQDHAHRQPPPGVHRLGLGGGLAGGAAGGGRGVVPVRRRRRGSRRHRSRPGPSSCRRRCRWRRLEHLQALRRTSDHHVDDLRRTRPGAPGGAAHPG